jgi:dihydrofolate reductase
MAAGMNRAEKIVFSRTLDSADWHNTRIIRDNMVEQIRQLKQNPGNDLTLLGSGSILTQFADHGLIDEYQIMLDPVAIGQGTPLFNDISRPLDLKLTMSRTFKSGVVLLHYQPV